MIATLKKIFGMGSKTDFPALMNEGAQILDVRSPVEFQGGHINGAVNIPLQMLRSNLAKIKKDKPVITCCASGMRSASAKNMLEGAGYTRVYNGGGWMALQKKLG
jgi:phage shock protein E